MAKPLEVERVLMRIPRAMAWFAVIGSCSCIILSMYLSVHASPIAQLYVVLGTLAFFLTWGAVYTSDTWISLMIVGLFLRKKWFWIPHFRSGTQSALILPIHDQESGLSYLGPGSLPQEGSPEYDLYSSVIWELELLHAGYMFAYDEVCGQDIRQAVSSMCFPETGLAYYRKRRDLQLQGPTK